MTSENQENILEKNDLEMDSDCQSSGPDKDGPKTSGTKERLPARDLFAGNEDFYKSLEEPAQQRTIPRPQAVQFLNVPIQVRRFSILQKALAGGIIAITATLIYAYLESQPESGAAIVQSTASEQMLPAKISAEKQQSSAEEQQSSVAESSVAAVPKAGPQPPSQQIQEPASVPPPTQPLSLKVAETFFLKKDYEKAYTVYDQLRQRLMTSGAEELLRDFLQLKMALCIKQALNTKDHLWEPDKTVDSDHAGHLLRGLLWSRSPAIRVLAAYYLSLLEMQKKQYLKARANAYQAIALIGAINPDADSVASLQHNCQFLISESITRNILSLCDADKDLPEDLWSHPDEVDPLTNLDEAQLYLLLNSGSEHLRKGLLVPQIQKLEYVGSSPKSVSSHWSAACQGASISELLARFAAKAGLDVHWAAHERPIPEKAEDPVRERLVSLFMPTTTAQELVGAAAGCVGLLARLDNKETVSVFNPAEYSLLSDHTALLCQEAISLWQRFLLVFHDDDRTPNAHFAIALMRAQMGQTSEAIAEYKLVANRFSHCSVAPFALLRSSKLKTGIHDYAGAREDLKQLVEQYPDIDFSGQACLYLADATMKAGQKTEAARLYRKVYNLGFSFQSQVAAALGAGRCFYENGDHANAAKWLTRYIELAKNSKTPDLYSAYSFLGKTALALGKPKEACSAFQQALTAHMTRQEYVETLSALVKAHLQQEQFIEALDTLENVRSWQLSPRQLTDILLVKASVLRAMGLIDKAMATIGDREQYSLDTESRARISLELARCYVARGNLELAHTKLTDTLVLAEPGPLAHEIALELADVCAKLDQDTQTISTCLRLLDSEPSEQIEHKALVLLARAYEQQKSYDKAAMALLGRWDRVEGTYRKGPEPRPVSADYPQLPYQTGLLRRYED